MVDFEIKESYKFDDLLRIMEILRAPDGCMWDREQDHHSIRRNFIEETYEVCEAIDDEDTEHMKEELGDVLLQVVFHTQMEKEKGTFDIDDVADGICKKLIFRHPHIFGNVEVGELTVECRGPRLPAAAAASRTDSPRTSRLLSWANTRSATTRSICRSISPLHTQSQMDTMRDCFSGICRRNWIPCTECTKIHAFLCEKRGFLYSLRPNITLSSVSTSSIGITVPSVSVSRRVNSSAFLTTPFTVRYAPPDLRSSGTK